MLRAFREQFDEAWIDRLAYSVQREDFEAKTLHVFGWPARASSTCRSACTPKTRRAATQPKGPAGPHGLPSIGERFKR